MKKALITGVAGQDGSYLAELLLDKKYEVHGIIRRSSLEIKSRIDHLYKGKGKHPNFKLHYGDVTDSSNIENIIAKVKPDEIYNLAAQSHVRISFDLPEYTANVDALGTLRILNALLNQGLKHTRFYQASTSELYGKVQEVPQTEKTPFYPRSPYGVAKLYSFWIVKNYREAYEMFASNGILFNHESPRRGNSFVTKKIVEQAVKIKHGLHDTIKLGNIYAKRDWGHAKDYVEGMWRMLQQDKADDYVLATGETHSVKEFIELVFKELNLPIAWKGSGIEETGYNPNTNQTYIKIDPYYFRPTEVDLLIGDPSKAINELGWKNKYGFKGLVKDMIEHELSIHADRLNK
jgi:GDPmannose 4,6-dehydratase